MWSKKRGCQAKKYFFLLIDLLTADLKDLIIVDSELGLGEMLEKYCCGDKGVLLLEVET